MTIKYVVAHRTDPNNVGDIASNPLQYFLKPDEYQTIDIANLGREAYDVNKPLVVGGGGLIQNANFGEALHDLLTTPDKVQLQRMWDESWDLSNPAHQEIHQEFSHKYKNLIAETLDKIKHTVNPPKSIWGAGHNGDSDVDAANLKYPKWLVEYTNVGVRDWGTKFKWAPCASCMHPALRKTYAIKNDVIFFEHKKQLIKGTEFGSDPMPRFINSGSNVEQTIELLGSANIILTNSYHGAYWGTLLKKKVIIVGSWSGKFNFFKHQPLKLGKKDDWKDMVDRAPVFNEALDECVLATQNFWEIVR